MKRIKAACLEQTLHFLLREELPPEEAREQARREYDAYTARLKRQGTAYRVVEELVQPDGSLIVKIKRQNNTQPVGSYLD